MKILIAHSNFMKLDPKQLRKMQPYPPLGTLYTASRLLGLGFEVEFFDPTFSESMADFETAVRAIKPDIFILCEDYFNFLSKMCLFEMRKAGCRMCRIAADAGAVAIAAGPDMSAHPLAFLTQGAEYVVRGEPDITIAELCNALRRNGGSSARLIPGVTVLEPGGKLSSARPRSCADEIDSFPFPAWELADMSAYRKAWIKAHGSYNMIMASSRGCPYHCTWCSKLIWENHYVQRSAQNTVAEMAALRERFRPDHIWFADDIFGHNHQWMESFKEELDGQNFRIPYSVQTRIDLLSDPVVRLLSETGCREVWLGIESGSQSILDAMNKKLSIDEIEPAFNRLRKAGIRASAFIQFGYPGEELDDILLTVMLIRKLRPDDIGISVFYPLPGAPVYEAMSGRLNHKTRWDHSDDLSMLYRGPYDTEFYRKLHAVIHSELNITQRIARGYDHLPPDMLIRETARLNDAWFELGRMAGKNPEKPDDEQ